MKKLLVVAALLIPGAAVAAALPASYQAKWCYPTGTYWQQQIAKYPEYYASKGAKFESRYGAGTKYCP